MVRKKKFIGKKLKYHKKKYPEAILKRKEEMRKVREKIKEQKDMRERLTNMRQLYEDECKKRKRAENVANTYYLDWKAERQVKDHALENQIYKPSSLPDSFYISNALLNFNFNGGNEEEIIGSGVFGTVKLCEYKGSVVAAKCLMASNESTAVTKRSVIKEAKVILNLRSHKSIPTLIGVCLDEQPFKIILQLYQIQSKSITINSLCKKRHDITLNESEWHSIINQLAKAIDHVHMCGYLHNDIKTDNAVIYKSSDEFVPVLIDFGKSCTRENGSTKSLSLSEQESYRKQYRHIAPEVVDGSNKQSIYSDIYSFGYLVYCVHSILCKQSSKLRKIVKECYKVKTWNCRVSLARVSQILS